MRKTIAGTGGMLLIQTLKVSGVEGESVTTLPDPEPALRRGVERTTRDDRPYVIDVTVVRESIGAESTWSQDGQP